jgi:uncharacterized protein (TIGR03437 family)
MLPRPDWRQIGNAALNLSLASAATGPVERVWYSADGSRLYARTSANRTFVTGDFESWQNAAPGQDIPVTPVAVDAPSAPEPGARVRGSVLASNRVYAFGRFVHRSDDGGTSWTSLTNYKRTSILGEGMRDVAISPRNEEEVVVAASTGVWRSVDGGLSWSGLNQSFPNLPIRRLLGTPRDTIGVRVAVEIGGELSAFEWEPGEKQAWRPVTEPDLERELQTRRTLSQILQATITAVATAGDMIYAGSDDGRIWSSNDRGRTWNSNPDQYRAPVEALYADAREPGMALAALGDRFPDAAPTTRVPHIIRTTNGGNFWDDLTANLRDVAARGVTADVVSGAVYVATDAGAFVAFEDLRGGGPAAPWTLLTEALAAAPATDVRLDPPGHQLYVALEGFGVFAAPAPHRFRSPKAVSAADLTDRPAAPGGLITIFGANVRSAKAGSFVTPVLAASDIKSEIQVPFEAKGTSLLLALEAAGGSLTLGVPLQSAAPAIFVDAEGAPMVLDADQGVLLDTMRPARSNSRIQILATGLGEVKPHWPSGMAAPLDDPPSVTAPVRVLLDRVPIEVTRATLAPGYVGFYLVEAHVPKLVNYGPAELSLEVDGQPSNRVRVYIEP